ncbi:MAG: hypothetical protein GTO18_21520 [Anaerolineales bacterium]|nr:hypothetical protein [Anaerolineales bacterium]
MKKRLNWILLIVISMLAITQLGAGFWQQEEPIRVVLDETENDYPNGLTFRLVLDADHPITKVVLFYQERGDRGTTRQPIEITPDSYQEISYLWDTSQITVAPSSPVIYKWEITDEEGNTKVTEEELVYYDDLRFPWKERSDEDLIVRWYEGDDEFGEYIFDVARRVLDDMVSQAGQGLKFPVIILLYANEEDFESWHFYVDDWVGGQAFTSKGITTQILSPYSSSGWIQDVIPHEIAHLFFYQAVDSTWAFWPSWLDEGLAKYYEIGDNSASLEHVTRAAKDGTLLPLSSLAGGFGRDPEQVRLSYDESLSAVTYIIETWGDEGIQGLVETFREGAEQREAVHQAFGITWEEFIAAWLTWMGVPATPAPPPTLTPTYEPRAVPPTPRSSWPSATPSPASVVQVEEPKPTAETVGSVEQEDGDTAFCGGLFGLVLLPGIPWILRKSMATSKRS